MASHGIARARRDDLAAALDAVRSIVRALRVNAHAIERQAGIGGAQLFVLQQLARGPARSMNELAQRTHTHQSSVSVVASRLAERGLIVRSPSSADRRRLEIALTPKGRALLRGAPVTVQARLIEGLRKLPAHRLAALAQGLHAWLRAAKVEAGRPPLLFEESADANRPWRSRARA
ncbi:MAG TPA: MarR family transcriptional regulator [Usitatibacter sp.]|jgi:DNA-binding MarR family transcriptional regulator|nr:MarR family transcriptional regulator [Usitatibacter sp.]